MQAQGNRERNPLHSTDQEDDSATRRFQTLDTLQQIPVRGDTEYDGVQTSVIRDEQRAVINQSEQVSRITFTEILRRNGSAGIQLSGLNHFPPPEVTISFADLSYWFLESD